MRGAATALALAAFLAFTGVTVLRTARDQIIPGQPSPARNGLHDFNDNFYYPAVALLDGVNPYNAPLYMSKYPTAHAYPPFSPTMLLLHLPFVVLPVLPAAWLYFALTIVCMLLLAALVLEMCGMPRTPAAVLTVTTVMIASRAGHMNLHLGQVTVFMVLPMLAALHYGSTRPWLAGLAVAIVWAKPTFGVPLVVLLLCRRQWRPVLIGGVLAAVLLGFMGIWLARVAGGLGPLIASYRDAFVLFGQDHGVNPVTASSRLDLIALLAHLLGRPLGAVEPVLSVALLALGGFGVARLARPVSDPAERDNDELASLALACFTSLVFTYHLFYDSLLLAMPAVALAGRRLFADLPALRIVLLLLIAFLAFNYFASDSAMVALHIGSESFIYRVLTALNAAAVFPGYMLLLWFAFRTSARSVPARVAAA